MRILVVAVGSRGDVAPYAGLGQRLQAAGHDVTVATHETFRGFVTDAGLGWRHVSGDPQTLIRDMTSPPSPGEARRQLLGFASGLGDDIAAAAELGTDLILTCLGQAALSYVVARGLGVPAMGAYVVPSVPSAELVLPRAQVPPGAGPAEILASGQRLLDGARAVYAGVLPGLAARVGLPASAADEVWEGWLGRSGRPILLGYSAAVVPRPGDWPSNVEVVGYWWPPVPRDWQPDGQLLAFLDAGPPPVYIGFGSMGVGVGDRLADVVGAAVRAAGVRAVVQAGWAGLEVAGDDVLVIGDAPHAWLLPRTAAAVHHAGAGTTGAVLRAGLPTVGVPFLADQPYWAGRLHALGVGPEPVPFAELTAPRLAGALRALVGDPGHRGRAEALARALDAEDGAGAVVAAVDRLT